MKRGLIKFDDREELRNENETRNRRGGRGSMEEEKKGEDLVESAAYENFSDTEPRDLRYFIGT